MRLINTKTGLLSGFYPGTAVPEYAIVSHTWTSEDRMLHTFPDTGIAPTPRDDLQVQKCCEIAGRDGIEWLWIDRCCVDQTPSSAEMSEMINSTYERLSNAVVCYAHLADVGSENPELSNSRWFTRLWTLQELVAPKEVIFYSNDWQHLGTRSSLAKEVSRITRIAQSVLLGSRDPRKVPIGERLSWTNRRTATRPEDAAYSLLGLFNVRMSVMYGEGKSAVIRLSEQILREKEDYTTLLWSKELAMLPPSSKSEENAPNFDRLEIHYPNWEELKLHSPFDMTNYTTPFWMYDLPWKAIPEPPYVTSRGYRVNLLSKTVSKSLISWTYSTQMKEGGSYAVCIRIVGYYGPSPSSDLSHFQGKLTGEICYIKVERLRSFRPTDIYFSLDMEENGFCGMAL
jgi:hypothetical protein